MNGTRGSFEELKALVHEQLEQLEMQGYGSTAVEGDDYPRPIPPQPITPPSTYRSTHPPMQPTSFAPSIQVYPPSQTSTSNYSMQGSWTGSLSTLAMSVIADGFGAVRVRPQVSFSEINDFNSVAGTPSSSSSRNPGDYNVRAADAVAGMDREAMFAQTRRFSRVADGSAPDPRSSSEANIRAEAAADARFSPTENGSESPGLSYVSEQEMIVTDDDIDDDGYATPYYSPLSGSRSPSPNPSSDEDVTSLDIPPTELEYTDPTTTTDDEPHKPHSNRPTHDNIPTDILVDSESVTSASFSITTMPTPFLPLLRTPPNLRFHLDLNERLDHLLSSHPTDAPAQSFTPAQTLMMMIVEAVGSPPPSHPTRVPRRQGSVTVMALTELMHSLTGPTEQSHGAGIDGAHPMGGVIQLRTGSYSGGARRYNGTLLADVKASLVEILERVLMHLRANTTASERAPITRATVLLESSPHSMVTRSVDSHVVEEASAVDSNSSRNGMHTEPADSQQVQRSSNQTRSSSGMDSDPGEYVGTNDHPLVTFDRRDVEILPMTTTRQA
ncbi:hypothetical protein BDN70DRAFT_936480 [Pholiota conissans]|uniref:Uncharacterized protein n=1 Tax=Pholiota conissans TaxID=109636 RepID=A0A9P5YTV8_9AGAR|nr:hypothetical protein BDN70DRAFT_936480 [Pholiota conissans]